MIPFLTRYLVIASLLLAAFTARAEKASVTLAWNANPESTLGGYKVYTRTAGSSYKKGTDVGKSTTTTISNLTAGTTYYFVVTAYNSSGVESPYSAEVSKTVDGTNPSPTPTPSPTATPSPGPSATPQPKYLLNISTRVRVKTGDGVMIGGFIISGSANKDVIIRALGPSLASLGVRRPLSNPILEVYNSAGELIVQNDDWTSLPAGTVPADLQPADPTESVIVISLPPGSYTSLVRGVDGSIGNSLHELYDLSPGSSTVSNISTRGQVGVGDDVMIGGFIVGGTAPSKVMVRAIGPSLAAVGLTGILPNPVLELHDQTGALIYQNDDWQQGQAQEITDTSIPPSDEHESAIIATLEPGAYTAVVRDASGKQGLALVEVYALDQ